MSSAYVTKVGARRPYLRHQLTLDGKPLNLSGATVVFQMRNHGEDTIAWQLAVTRVDILAGIVEVPSVPGPTDTRAIYDCTFWVTFEGGEPMPVPGQGFVYLLVE